MEEMRLFKHRLNSFGKRGCNWPHKHYRATGLRLAQVGFYYDSKDNIYNDNVTCYLCKCSHYGWKKDDAPMEIHKKISPQCPLVIILDYSKNWVSKPTDDATYEPESNTLFKARLATFKNWWPHTYPNITPERIAEAGLYYAPDIDSEDKVECAYCKAKFDYWTSNDNPRSKHFRFKEKCPFFRSAQLKRRKLKSLLNEKKKDEQKDLEDEGDLTDVQTNKKKTRYTRRNYKARNDEEDETDLDDETDDDNENEVEVKKTYNTRYATREIKKVNYVEEDTDDDMFSSDEDDSEEEEGGEGEEEVVENDKGNEENEGKNNQEEKEENVDNNNNNNNNNDDDDNNNDNNNNNNGDNNNNNNIGDNNNNNGDNNNNDDIINNQDDSILVDNDKKFSSESSDEEKLSKKIERKHNEKDGEKFKDSDILKDDDGNGSKDGKTENNEPDVILSKDEIKKHEKNDEKKKDSDYEYVKSSESDFSYASSSYEELVKRRSSGKRKRPRKVYKKRKKKHSHDSIFDDEEEEEEELDTEEEELRTQEIRKLLSTENGYLGPLPKIKSKVVIEEEKKLYEEMKRQAEENGSSDFENTNPEFISVATILRKRKKEQNHYEIFSYNSLKRISLPSNEQEIATPDNDKIENNNNLNENIDNNDNISISNDEEKIEKNNSDNENIPSHSTEKSVDNSVLSKKEFNDPRIKTPIKIEKIQQEKDFTIVKLLSTISQSIKKPKNLLESISKQRIEDIFKDTPIKLVDQKKTNYQNSSLKISEEDINANNLFMIDDEDNLDLLKEKIIEILLENSRNENGDNKDNNEENKNEDINNNDMDIDSVNDINDQNQVIINDYIDDNSNDKNNKMAVDDNNNENVYNSKKEMEVIEILDDSSDDEKVIINAEVKMEDSNNIQMENVMNKSFQGKKQKENNSSSENENSTNIKIENDQGDKILKNSNEYEEMEENLKDDGITDVKSKNFYEIKSSDKKILKELSFSITTPEPNSPKINPLSEKSDSKTFKTPLSSQVKNFHLSSDISLEETVEALLSTPTPLPLSLNSKSYLKNDKELLMKTIMEENKKSLKKLNKTSKSLTRQNSENKQILSNTNDNRKLKINDSVKSNKSITNSIAENDDNNISFMSYDDSNVSFMFKNDDSVIIRSKQKPEDNIERIVDTIHRLKETIDTVNDVSMLVLDTYKEKREMNTTNNVLNSQDLESKSRKQETPKSLEKSLNGSVNEEEILDNYFNNLINTPANKSTEKPQQKTQRVIEVDEDVLSLTVGQYLEKVNREIAKNLRTEGEEKIRDYYKQLFNIEDLYIKYLDKMVSQLQEYPKDKKILESQTKLMKNTLNNDRKSIKMEIETSTAL